MSIDQIYQAMERNRRDYEQQIAHVRSVVAQSPQLEQQLSDTWIEAMRMHYQLLWDYLQRRDLATKGDGCSASRLQPDQLRAPRRPAELPESLSRYVTTQHAEHVI